MSPKAAKAKVEPEGKPTDSRIRRVHVVVHAHPGYQVRLTAPNIEITPPSGPLKVSKEVVEIATAMHADGVDACMVKKEAVLEYAKKLLGEAPAATKPEEEGPSASKLSKVESILDAEPAFKRKKETVVACRNGSKEYFSKEAIQIAKALGEKGKNLVSVKKADVIAEALKVFKKPAAAAVATAKKVVVDEADDDKVSVTEELANVNFALGCYTQLLCAYQVAELDHESGAEARRKQILDLVGQYKKLANKLASRR